MPVVPRLNDNPVQEASTPNVRFSADAPLEAFGGGEKVAAAFEAGQKLTGVVADIVKEEQKSADALAVSNYKDKLIREKNKLFWGDEANGFSGAKSKTGKEALAAKENYLAAFKDFSTKEYESLSNDRQKSLAAQVMREQEYDLSGNLNRHVAGEIEKFRTDVTKSAIASLTDDASKNWMTEGKISSVIQDQRKAIMEYAGTANIPLEQQNEVVKRQIKETESKTHSSVINSMINSKEPAVAQVYFNAVKDSMTSEDSQRVSNLLKEGTTRMMGQQYEDELIKRYPNDEPAALKAAREIDNPDHRDEAVRRVKLRFNEDREAQRAQSENRSKVAIEFAKQNKERPAPEMWNALSPEEQKVVDTVIQGGYVVTDVNRLYKLKQMVHTPEFKDMNLALEMNRIAPNDLQQLMDLQTGLRGGNAKSKELADGIRSDQEIINTNLKAAGINPSAKNKNVQDTVNNFRYKVDQIVVREQARLGRKVTNEELEGIVRSQLKTGITEQGTLFDTKKKAFELNPGEKFIAVPKDERQKIVDELNSKKIPVTEKLIIDLFNRKTFRQ